MGCAWLRKLDRAVSDAIVFTGAGGKLSVSAVCPPSPPSCLRLQQTLQLSCNFHLNFFVTSIVDLHPFTNRKKSWPEECNGSDT